MRSGLVAVTALLAGALPMQANAALSTIVQTVSNTSGVFLSDPTSGSQPLVSGSFFDGIFLPFVGANLQFAVLQVTFKFEGNVLAGTGGSSASVNFGGILSLNGTSYSGDGAGNSTGGAPGSSTPLNVTMINTSSNLVGNSLNPVFATYVNGSSPFNFTYGTAPVSPANFTLGGAGAQLTGTLTSTEVLTYSYSGEGALLQVDVPEPASLALMAAGVLGLLGARRRQA